MLMGMSKRTNADRATVLVRESPVLRGGGESGRAVELDEDVYFLAVQCARRDGVEVGDLVNNLLRVLLRTMILQGGAW